MPLAHKPWTYCMRGQLPFNESSTFVLTWPTSSVPNPKRYLQVFFQSLGFDAKALSLHKWHS